MKKLFVLLLLFGIALTSCKDAKKGNKAVDHQEHDESEKNQQKPVALTDGDYIVNVGKSSVKWKGFKPTGSHNGTLNFDKGVLQVKEGKIAGGKFVMDMESIKVLDIPADDEYNGKLVGHLKNADFFDVEKHKTASFDITSADNHKIEGNLTIKGISKPIAFDISVSEKDGKIQFSSNKIVFDRTDYGIKYKSKKFFDNIKDKFINDEIEVSFDVEAIK